MKDDYFGIFLIIFMMVGVSSIAFYFGRIEGYNESIKILYDYKNIGKNDIILDRIILELTENRG